MTRIFLIGYMGAGKTTLGKAFAREMSLNFIDLDWFIEERFHKTVQQLFLERGEDGFRELERKMLHEVAEFEDVVVSTGGGTPCFFDNMEYMNDCGDTVFLDIVYRENKNVSDNLSELGYECNVKAGQKVHINFTTGKGKVE